MARIAAICALAAAALFVASPADSVVASCPGTGSTFAGGAGTSASPYLIATAAQLASIDTVGGGYMGCSFLQTADISLAAYSNWVPIGGVANMGFSGEFDGGGHRIEDVTITNASVGNALFNFAQNAVFRHIHLSITSMGSYNVAGLVSSAQFTSVDDVHVDGTLVDGGTATGLIAGQFTYGTITRSSSRGSVTTSAYGGGLVGIFSMATMANSYSRASVAGGTYIGGLIGEVFACCSTVPSIVNSYASGAVTGGANLGGLVGSLNVANNTPFTNTATFWDSQTSGRSTSVGGGTDRTTVQMKDLTTFTGANWNIVSGFDQQSIWGICSLANDGYPFLQIEAGGVDPCTVVASPAPQTPPSTSSTIGDVVEVIPVFTG